MRTDALSDVLRAFHLTGSMFFRVRLRAPYAVGALGVRDMIEQYAPGVAHMLPFHLVTRGPMWFEVDGAEPVLLEEDDIIVLPHGADHSLTDRPGSPAISVRELGFAIDGFPQTLEWGGGGEPAEAMCGFFHCNGRLFNPLLDALPGVVVIRHDSERTPWLAAMLRQAFDETIETRPGGAALIARLTELLFLEVVQQHLTDGGRRGWLGALNDPIAGAALAVLHAQPERTWTLESIAREIGTSRSVLAERFAAAVGLSPIRYLSAWRMELAAQRLEETTDTIGEIAASIGYDSEAAFNRAFKRHTGEPPAAWRRRHHPSVRAIHS